MGHEHAHARTALGITLRHGVHDDDIVLDPFEGQGADIGLAVVAEFAVDFVGDEEEVMAADDVAQGLQLGAAVDIAGRVVGVADQDAPGAGRDDLLEFFDRRKGEAVLDAGGHAADLQSGGHGEAQVVGVAGLDHDELVTRVEAGQEGQQQGFGAAAGHHDLVGGDADAEAGVIARQGLTQGQKTGGMAVFQGLAVNVPERVQRLPGCREVRLADVQMVYFRAPFLRRVGEWNEFPDRRSGNVNSPL